VLSHAVPWHSEVRVIRNGNHTIVFASPRRLGKSFVITGDWGRALLKTHTEPTARDAALAAAWNASLRREASRRCGGTNDVRFTGAACRHRAYERGNDAVSGTMPGGVPGP
jgi:hypothetical protein